MFRRVLVPFDGGPHAITAARLAVRLARSGKGRVRAAYVVDRALIAKAFVGARPQLQRELEIEGRRALRRVRLLCRRLGVPYSETLAEGDVLGEILRLARSFRADVIVISTSGRGQLASLVRGSLLPRLVSQTPCPLLVVRRRTARRRR